MQMVRLQGSAFSTRTPVLRIVAYHISRRGNVCGYYRYLDNKYASVYHWMNDTEKEQFLSNPPNVPEVPDHETASKIKVEVTNMKDYKKLRQQIVEEIKAWFDKNGPTANAVIGISGGKDSTVCAALLTEALGKDRVVGVLMPNGIQADIADSYEVVNLLGIRYFEVPIGETISELHTAIETSTGMQFTDQANMNMPPRIRMTTLYAIAQIVGGFVIGTGNLSERHLGWFTKFGDGAFDYNFIADYTATEIVLLGDALDLPTHLVHKVPSDGLCGLSDETKFGFSYKILDAYIRGESIPEPDIKNKIDMMYNNSKHKR